MRILLIQDCYQFEGCSPAEVYRIVNNDFTQETMKQGYLPRYLSLPRERRLSLSWVEWLKKIGVIEDFKEGEVIESGA